MNSLPLNLDFLAFNKLKRKVQFRRKSDLNAVCCRQLKWGQTAEKRHENGVFTDLSLCILKLYGISSMRNAVCVREL